MCIDSFYKYIGSAKAQHITSSAKQLIWQSFNLKSSIDKKNMEVINLFVDNTSSISYKSNDEIHFSAE